LAVKPFIVLSNLARHKIFEDVKYNKISELIYEKTLILYKDHLEENMYKIFTGLQNQYGEVAIIFDFMTYQFKDNIEELKELAKSSLAMYENQPGMFFKMAVLIRNGISKASDDLKREDLFHVANSVHVMIKPPQTISDELTLKLTKMKKYHFLEGTIPFEEYSAKTYTILSDDELVTSPKLNFTTIKADTKTQTLSVKEGSLTTLLKSLPYTKKEAGSLVYDMENQTILRGYHMLYVVLTQDKEKNVDGLLFVFEIESEEIESSTTINFPGGSREGVPRKMIMPKIKSIHLKGIADTDGPLSKGKITLEEYLEKLANGENFIKARRYFMNIEMGDFPLLSSLVR
ncbi:MAG: hypothetical protein ACTSQF_12630, partial [Candidatus Heimdallarchaeaceae archaeon]